MKHNENGFSVVEVVLLFVVIAIVGFAGWYVYKAKNDTIKNESTAASTTAKTQVVATVGSLNIKEWGVKLAMIDANKVEYVISTNPGSLLDENKTSYEASATFSVKTAFRQDKACDQLNMMMLRSKTPVTNPNITSVKVGSYTYFMDGGGVSCGNKKDDDLIQTLREEVMSGLVGLKAI